MAVRDERGQNPGGKQIPVPIDGSTTFERRDTTAYQAIEVGRKLGGRK